jgi:hypothetical protein
VRILVAALLAVFVLFAAAPRPMAWSALQRSLQVVEQQGDIVNPMPCAWDVDDRIDGVFSGVIEKGGSIVHTECIILDHHAHLVGLRVGDGLSGTITIGQPTGTTISGSTFATGCLLSPEYGNPEYLSLPQIGDGHGDRVSATWTITNTSGHRLGKSVAFTTIQLVSGQAKVDWGCQ